MNQTQATFQRIKDLFPLVPNRQGWQSPKFVVMGRRQYRGKERYVAGYGHSRSYSHHFNGLVYDRIVGWGETQDDAILMMESRLLAARSKGAAA